MPPTYQRKSGWNIAFQDSCTHSSLTFTHKHSPFPHSKTHYSFTFTYNHTLLPHIHTTIHTLLLLHKHPFFRFTLGSDRNTFTLPTCIVTILKYIYQLTSPPCAFQSSTLPFPSLSPPPLFSIFPRYMLLNTPMYCLFESVSYWFHLKINKKEKQSNVFSTSCLNSDSIHYILISCFIFFFLIFVSFVE